MTVNADVRYSGHVACEVLEAGRGETGEAVTIGKPIPGFTLADCAPVTADRVDAPLTWRGGELSSLRGRSIRLRFDLFKADLFAIRFIDSQ